MSLTPDQWLELLKYAFGLIISGIVIPIANNARKQAKKSAEQAQRAADQTATTHHVDGQLRVRSTAQTTEQTAEDVAALKYVVDGKGGLVDQIRDLRSEVGQIPGKGRRRAATASHPIVKEEPHADPW